MEGEAHYAIGVRVKATLRFKGVSWRSTALLGQEPELKCAARLGDRAPLC